ncbi:MAG: tetratricopeptide repeat protein [Spirochaetaceae bacterium]|nr:tetratricopeptide repeat protein [Spirochaetaceae bacterium]
MIKTMTGRSCNLIFILLLILFTFCSCAGGLSRKEASKLYYNLGNAYFDLGQNDKASDAYLKALSYDKKMKIASFNLAKSYIEANKFTDAIAILDKMLKKEPKNVILLSAKAYCIYRFGDTEKAYELYNLILRIDSGNVEALFNSAVIKVEEGSYTDALEKLEILKTKKIDDDKILKRINSKIGEIYYNAGEYYQSIDYLKYTQENDPENIGNLKMLFDSYIQIQAYSSAIDIGNQILNDEKDKDILFQISFIYLTAIEDRDKGISFLSQAIAEGFSDKEKASLLMEKLPKEMLRSISTILKKEKLLD